MSSRYQKPKKNEAVEVAEEEPPKSNRKPDKKNKSAKVSHKKTERDESRMTNFRAQASERTTQENREALFEKLFFGFKNVNEAMKNIQVQQVKRTVMLPVSTRSCGFMIRNLTMKLQRLRVLDDTELYSLTNSLYRISLHQLDYKIEEAMTLVHPRNLMRSSFDDTYLSGDVRRALDMMGAGFSPLVNYLSSVGMVKTTNAIYLPRHPKLSTLSCSPFYLHTSNIRAVLDRIAHPNIDPILKEYFYLHCPVPGAKWDITVEARNQQGEIVPGNIALTNVDDIWPSVYGLQQMRDDITIIASCIEKVGRKYPKYVSTGGVDWRAVGSVSQIVSTSQANIRCPSYPVTLGMIEGIAGEHSRFWTPGSLSDPEAYMGVVYLLGEVEHPFVHEPRCFSYREENSGIDEIDLDYASVLQNLIN